MWGRLKKTITLQSESNNHQYQKRPSHWSIRINVKFIGRSVLRTNLGLAAKVKGFSVRRWIVLIRFWSVIFYDKWLFSRRIIKWYKIQIFDTHAKAESTRSLRSAILTTFDGIYSVRHWKQTLSTMDKERSIWCYFHKLNEIIQKFKPKNRIKWSHKIKDAWWKPSENVINKIKTQKGVRVK